MTVTGDASAVTPVSDRLLDQLADGELDPRQRQVLLAALDREPGGWRRCAMAFLEAQAWGESLRPAESASVPPPALPRVAPPRRAIRFMRLGGIAAAVAVAFAGGFVARGPSSAGPQPSSYAATSGSTPPGPAARAAVAPPPAPALPDYLRRQLEREGYEVKGDQKLVPVALADGRHVAVPVETLKYRFVGYRVH